jgi:vesicle coat complex subunit
MATLLEVVTSNCSECAHQAVQYAIQALQSAVVAIQSGVLATLSAIQALYKLPMME